MQTVVPGKNYNYKIRHFLILFIRKMGLDMSNPWFRLYAEILNDHKVQMLPEVYRWRLVALMCIRCNVAETLPDSAIAFHLRITEKEWQTTKKAFIANQFIDLENNLINWNKRQFISDSSTERSKRHREKLKVQRCGDVAATAPDTDTDTDTEYNKKPTTNVVVKKEKFKLPENFTVTEKHRELAQQNDWPSPDQEIEAFRDHHIAKANKFADWDRAFHTWLRNSKTRFPEKPSPQKINSGLQAEIQKTFSEVLPVNPINQWSSLAAKDLQARIDEDSRRKNIKFWRNLFLLVKCSKNIKQHEWHLDYLIRDQTFANILNGKRSTNEEIKHYKTLIQQKSSCKSEELNS